MRVAYTLEQCWHRVPGGTGVAAMRVAEAMGAHPDVTLLGVAGRHAHVPDDPWSPSIPIGHLPVGGPLLYDLWLRGNWPKVERATGPIDVAHATTVIPCATDAPLVVTVHDLAFLHDPSQFTRRGNSIFRRSLDRIRRACRSRAVQQPGNDGRLRRRRRRGRPCSPGAARGRARHSRRRRDRPCARRVPAARALLLFVGTVEPRKNLRGLVEAIARLDEPLPLVAAGADGWGDVAIPSAGDTRFIGFVPAADLGGLYAGAEVFCYPSEREGYGLPVLEAMAQGTPVVTSRGTATEEAAGGAAVLVDPLDPDDIARGITEATAHRAPCRRRVLPRRSGRWGETARLTAEAYRELC